MLLSTKQMSIKQQLEHVPVNIKSCDQPLERVSNTKLLGVHINQHLTWQDHITNTLSSCYGTLSVLRKVKNFAPKHVRKNLVESLVLSKLDYYNTVFGNTIHQYQMQRLQRVQNSCAAFVLSRYAQTNDLKSLGWFPVRQRLELSAAKLAHKSFYYISTEIYVFTRNEIKFVSNNFS